MITIHDMYGGLNLLFGMVILDCGILFVYGVVWLVRKIKSKRKCSGASICAEKFQDDRT